MASTDGYIRIEGANICYTQGGDKYVLPYDSGYSSSVGTANKGYIWIDETDVLRIYYVDEYGVKRRTDIAESLGNVGVNNRGYTWVGNDGYLYFVGPGGAKMRIIGPYTPISGGNRLCFTSTSAFSIELRKIGNPTTVNLEVSNDGSTRSDYTIGTTLNLASGSSLYMRNKSSTPTGFSTGSGDFYYFVMNGSVNASGDVTTLLCKDGTTTLTTNYCFYDLLSSGSLLTAPSLPATTLTEGCYFQMFLTSGLTTAPSLPATALTDYCYAGMFDSCTNLTSLPLLTATTLAEGCYEGMFWGCTSLTTLPSLPATALTDYCYESMFRDCTSIKISETQTGIYQTPYRIPSSGTGTVGEDSLMDIFYGTGGTFTGTPTINTTYYTSNTVI